MRENTRKIATQLCISAAFLWIGVKYLLPLCLPFLLGAGLAIAAEPGTDVLHRRLKLSRSIAGAISVSVVFLLGGALTDIVSQVRWAAGRAGPRHWLPHCSLSSDSLGPR